MNFTIKDRQSIRSVIFKSISENYFNVEVSGDIFGTIKVYSYMPNTNTIANFFKKFEIIENPWDGEISWLSLEGEFSIVCTCNPSGHVYFKIVLDNDDSDFIITFCIGVDLGELKTISSQANNFFRTVA
ncbi:MAG: hypothetical protein HRU38_18460 [Saccharospirillaceae bacterium]|nr:DUF6228 family protein [Pseudomonadales bacterium]NRB80621.1 hypothetical protein [Saccharospirillaceae bacterium]